MTELIRQAFERFGADVCVEHAGQSVCTRAFVQPLTAESNREPFSVAPLGAVAVAANSFAVTAEGLSGVSSLSSGRSVCMKMSNRPPIWLLTVSIALCTAGMWEKPGQSRRVGILPVS